MVRDKSLVARFASLLESFFSSEQSSGIVLLICTLAAVILANSPWSHAFLSFWQTSVGYEGGGLHLEHSLRFWINNALMAIFFLMIGLEIERELYIGELADLKKALLPVLAAIGGMVTPAAIHFLFNAGTPTQSGMGIPMATDIAFALGGLVLVGPRIPRSLKIFLASLAIIDDLGAIVVIALFYGESLKLVFLVFALALWAGLMLLNRMGIRNLACYLLPGLVLWYCIYESGIHASMAGVLLAFAIPFRGGHDASPSYLLQRFLHKPVAYGVMPLFALANTGIEITGGLVHALLTTNCLGIAAGLLVGKPLGISAFSYLAVKSGLSQLSQDLTWRHIIGAGFLGGIGFTMSIFITLLAFDNDLAVLGSKITILLSSLTAGTVGYLVLRNVHPRSTPV